MNERTGKPVHSIVDEIHGDRGAADHAEPVEGLTCCERRPTLDIMLTPVETEQLRARLKDELGRLVAHGHSALDFTMDRDRDRIGRDTIDESAEEELYSTQLRLVDRENFFITKIQEALKRLETGDIDECEGCSEAIGFKRLMARPVTTLCFECKTAKEQVEADEPTE